MKDVNADLEAAMGSPINKVGIAVARPFFIGKQPETVMNVFELVKQSQEQTAAKLRPGVTAKEIDETSREVLINAGIGKHFVYTGVHY